MSLKNTLLLLLVPIQFCVAQLTVQKQVELLLKSDQYSEMQIVSLDSNGVVLVNLTYTGFGRNQFINFTKFDSTLTEKWQQSFELPPNFKKLQYLKKDNFLYYYFQEENEQKFNILRLNTVDGQNVVNEGVLLTRMAVDYFEIVGSKALLGGSYNDRAIVEMFNFVDNSSKVLAGLYANNQKIQGINDIAESTEFIVSIRNNRTCLVTLFVFDYDGKLRGSYQLGDKNNVPLTGSVLSISDKKMLFIGNYADNCSSYSSGLYVHDLLNKKTAYYDFGKLENYFNYLPEKKQNRIKSKIEIKKEKGKNYKIRNRILLHKVMPMQNGWVIIAEIFYPDFSSDITNSTLSYRTYRIDNQVFNQFNYSHAFIGKFDNNGEMVWNNSFNLKNIKSFELNEITQLTSLPNGYLIAYPDDGFIRTGFIDKENQITELESYDIKELDLQDRIVSLDDSSLLAWFGNSFLVYGNKRISKIGVEGSFDVFFLQKLSYTSTTTSK